MDLFNITSMEAQKGNTVKVNYTGRLSNGEIFDTSDGREPIEFQIGGNQVIPAFESCLIGQPVGFKTTINIKAENAYGPVREDLITKITNDRLPEGVQVGQMLYASIQGQQIGIKVVEVNEDHIVGDANHPLAGKDLTFELELVGIN